MFTGKIGADGTYVSGKDENTHSDKKLSASCGGVSKAMVACMKERGSNHITAKVMDNTKKSPLHGFIQDNVAEDSHVFTDNMSNCLGIHYYIHEHDYHSTGEFVKEQAHVIYVESFWRMLELVQIEARHKISKDYLYRYVQEFTGWLNFRPKDTEHQIAHIVPSMLGDKFRHKDLVA